MLLERPSCLPPALWRIAPAHINNILLKKACEKRWKIVNINLKLEIIKNKKAIWERVEKATIFLKSDSKKALTPAPRRVVKPKKKINFDLVKDKLNENENKIKTPAVTSVDEWTREDTGVGAAMAAGNQAMKGNWALLVILNNTIKNPAEIIKLILNLKIINDKIIKKIESPTRLLMKVNILLFKVIQFL